MRLGALERVRAHQLGESIRLVGRRGANGTHLVQHDLVTAFGELPGGLRAGEASAHYVKLHASTYCRGRAAENCRELPRCARRTAAAFGRGELLQPARNGSHTPKGQP